MLWNRVCFCTFAVSLFASAYAGAAEKHARRLIGLPGNTVNSDLPPDQWFLQKLDHADPTNPGTWWQRYQVNDDWFKNSNNGPVFLMIGGEGPASAQWMVSGAWVGYAQKYGALCFQLEHRFYGNSQPKDDLSVENLKYLSSEQALADIANFIRAINKKFGLTENNKWVVFGGSYSGSLAAWARLKYPHLIHAAVSTSGPLLAEANFKGYDEVVRKSLAASSPECAENVHKAALAVEDLLKKPNGAEILSEKFDLCTKLDVSNKNDVANFAESLAGNFQGIVQYNKDNRASVLRNGVKVMVDNLCDIMVDNNKPLIDRYAAVNSLVNQGCIDITYYSYIQEMRSTSYNTSAGGRPWLYQTCTEFGFYQTSSSRNELFGSLFDLEFFIDQCKDIFDETFDENRLNEGIVRTNTNYGALNIEVSRVVFVQGSLDPWHVLGISKSTNPLAPAILINGTAHCANMYPPSPDDLPGLIAAREEIEQLLGDWLESY